MKPEVKKLIDSFMKDLQAQYPDMLLWLQDNEVTQTTKICHNRSDYEFSNPEFEKFAGELFYSFFVENNIYDVYFGFEYQENYSVQVENAKKRPDKVAE